MLSSLGASNSLTVGLAAILAFVLSDNWRTTSGTAVGSYVQNGGGGDCHSAAGDRRQMAVEERAKYAPLVMHTLAVYTSPADLRRRPGAYPYSAHFWFISAYKGADRLARFFNVTKVDDSTIYNIHDRKINVSDFYRPTDDCRELVTSQKYYILFATLKGTSLSASNDQQIGAIVEWSEENEAKVWRGLGWNRWTDWGACSVTCGGGTQIRFRYCSQPPCIGFNKEKRKCNMFSCKGTIEPLAIDNQKYFHPSHHLWEKVPDRESAWRIKQNYYLWLPATQVAFPITDFQKHFALIVSIRVDPTIRTEGTIFSLRSRSQPNSYLSLSLDGPDILRLIQSTPNGTQSVIIPAAITDGHWHQLALGIQDNVSVRSYLDCRWVSTDILKNNSLTDTEDADLVIGYLFTGDLEHLILVPDSGAVVQQCSTSKVSVLDRALSEKSTPKSSPLEAEEENTSQLRRRHHPLFSEAAKHLTTTAFEADWTTQKTISAKSSQKSDDTFSDDEDNRLQDGSGQGPVFEVEWSDWSECSALCGPGTQTRYLKCISADRNEEPCPISSTEHLETKECNLKTCSEQEYQTKHKSHPKSDISDNDIDVEENLIDVLQNHQIHEEDLEEIKKCKCLNGGTCQDNRSKCKCAKNFTGSLCEISISEVLCAPICHNGGICFNGTCLCPPGFTGTDCSSQICEINCEPGEICPPVTTCDCTDDSKFKCYNTTSCRPCLNGGSCLGNTCKCLPGWTGVDCSIATCKPACRNGGYCIRPNECLCRPGTTGRSCEDDTCGSGCLNEGVCVGYGICKCPPNVTGTMCENVICDPPCERGATCTSNNTCLCTPDMRSSRCAEKKCYYKAVRKPYTVGKRKLAKRKHSSKCGEQNFAECFSRLVPKFQTVYRTIYRTEYECETNTTVS